MPTDIAALGGTVLTELARTFENFQTKAGQFFPSRNLPVKTVTVERVYGGAGIAPVVDPKKPDTFADRRQVVSESHNPIYSRESFTVDSDTLNNLRQPGTLNERYGKQYIADEIKRLVARNDLLFDFLRYQMLLGGIDYTDPRTNVHTVVSAGIPADHMIPLNSLAATWTDTANAKPIDDLEMVKLKIRTNGKVDPTHILMNSVIRSSLSRNAQVIARGESARDTGFVVYQGGELVRIAGLEVVAEDAVYEALAPATVPTATVQITDTTIAAGDDIALVIGGVSSGLYTAVDGDTKEKVAIHLNNFINGNPAMPVTATVSGDTITLTPKNPLSDQSITITKSGIIDATIAGSPLIITGGGLVRTITKMIPDDKVVVVCKEAAGEPVGRTDFVIGEHPAGPARDLVPVGRHGTPESAGGAGAGWPGRDALPVAPGLGGRGNNQVRGYSGCMLRRSR
ncbi:major capsid protein [Desulfofundulus thermosubterraneus]|uniref:Phage major capsid protein E n=1 Tax=Desulfofundulus thermosubterraneus DSM 16057 TaxID=1121432 RepID=A0A1M6KMR1_9FIRM|nr:major capsid protein [Desulfofundulus thermosubterraneus]SHJ60144.1 Phage major capsid protein E [Desulfofundulus thermosubterraneus DSM 16057]